jgi:hypothetical protein
MGTVDKEALRKEKRFKAELLPEFLHQVTVLFKNDFLTCKVTDASLSGFGFIVALPISKILKGTSLAIYPLDEAHAVHGKITFSKAVDENHTRIGVQLQEVGREFAKYQEALKKIIAEADIAS